MGGRKSKKLAARREMQRAMQGDNLENVIEMQRMIQMQQHQQQPNQLQFVQQQALQNRRPRHKNKNKRKRALIAIDSCEIGAGNSANMPGNQPSGQSSSSSNSAKVVEVLHIPLKRQKMEIYRPIVQVDPQQATELPLIVLDDESEDDIPQAPADIQTTTPNSSNDLAHEIVELDSDELDNEEDELGTIIVASTSNTHTNGQEVEVLCQMELDMWARTSELPVDYESTLIGVNANAKLLPIFDCVLRHRRSIAEDSFARLDTEIWRHYNTNKQSNEIYQNKQTICNSLEKAIRGILKRDDVRLFPVGSTVNGCGSYNSDMDLCMTIPMSAQAAALSYNDEMNALFNKAGSLNYDICKKQALKLLYRVNGILRQCNARLGLSIAKSQVINAKVPIIKMEISYPVPLEMDININNIPGIYNSHMLRYYAEIDPRFPALALLVKHWAITNGINDSMNGTFNSYSLIMLLLHYLQCGVKPAVLPNLQYLFPERFAEFIALDTLRMHEDIRPDLPARPQNPSSVGELLIGFFEYYDAFDFSNFAISIRSGRVFGKEELAPNQKRYCIFIEEPYDFQNTARCVRYLDKINAAFKQTAAIFRRPSFTLHDIHVDPGCE